MSQERVTIISGPLAGRGFPLLESLTIGRTANNTIALDDAQVSRKHAVIERTPAGAILKDLGSGNGTYVNNRKIIEFSLSDGDVFSVGPVEIRYEQVQAPSAKAASRATEIVTKPSGDPAEDSVTAAPPESVFQTLFATPKDTVDAEQYLILQKRLSAIYAANQMISSERDLDKLFARVIDQILSVVPASNGAILLADEGTDTLSTAYERRGAGTAEIQMSATIVNRAFGNGEAVLVYDAAADERFDSAESIVSGGISSAMCVPLEQQDERLGVIYVDTRGTTNAFTQKDMELLVALAGPSAIAIKNVQYVDQLESDFQTTLTLLADAIELRDHYTVGHTWRVTKFSGAIAEELGWDEERKRIVEMGGVLHDLGKLGVEDAILRKPGRLTDEEMAKMRVHPERGADLMRDCGKLKPLIACCLNHHERYDGKGYPAGLAGDDIPIEGRILAVADTFDAMTSNRPYRKGLDPEIAIEELEKNRGTQFDPECADAFVRAYRSGKIDHILQAYHEQDEKSIVCPFCSTYIKMPEDTEPGDVFECRVCHRNVRLGHEDDAYFGELVYETDLT